MTKKTEKLELQKMVTPEFRVSYPHVFKPASMGGVEKKKYSLTMLFPKDKKIVGQAPDGSPRSLMAIIKAAKIAKWGEDPSEWPEDIQSPIQDGDSKKLKDKEGYAGHYVVKCASSEESKPVVVGRDPSQLITEPSEFYAGCYARAAVYALSWEFAGKQGVMLILDHVQKIRDGKPFSSKKAATEVFSALPDDDEDSEEMDF